MGTHGSAARPPNKGSGARGRSPPFFGPCLLWPNGWMDQDGTWHGARPWSSPHCARWVHSSPSEKGTERPQFSAHLCCGQTAGCVKMPLDMEVAFSLGDFVLDGDPAPYPKSGGAHPIFGPRLLWPNGCMDQDVTWYGGRPRPTRHIVFDVDPATPRKKAHPPHPIFGPCLFWPNGWMDEDAAWYGRRARPRPLY